MNAKCQIRWPVVLFFSASISANSIANAATDNGTLTVGGRSQVCDFQPEAVLGFHTGIGAIGSYSPVLLTGGKSVAAIVDITPIAATCFPVSFFNASGFSSNPGSSWLTSVTCNGVTRSAGTAVYTYSSGIASWRWSTQFGFTSGTVSCTIVHN